MAHSLDEVKKINHDLEEAGKHPAHHWTFKGTRMPWHTDDKPFGVAQRDWDREKALDSRTCTCGERGLVLLDRWYCHECWRLEMDDYEAQVDDGYEAHLDIRSA